MKIVRYRQHGKVTYGISENRRVVSLPKLAKQFDEQLPGTVEGFVSSGQRAIWTAERLLQRAYESRHAAYFASMREASLLAPIGSPPKIICLGLNYFDHAAETGKAVPQEPIIFMKPRTAIIGPNDKIVKPGFVKELDYEGELAVVIGKKAKNVPISNAMKYVFGYTIFDDISAREIQFRDGQWTRGKSFDTFAPMGPCITHQSQLEDTSDLKIRTWVNGELRQNGSTKNMVFTVAEIVHRLSRVMTMEPCDIIATGTPAGVAMAMSSKKWLGDGDLVRIEIEGIGSLENSVQEVKS